MKGSRLIGGAVIGCLAGALGGLGVVTGACHSQATTGSGAGTASSSTSSGPSSTSGTTGAAASSSSSGSGTGGAAPCDTPGTLHPPKLDGGSPRTLDCPGSEITDGGFGPQHCLPGQEHCCEPPNPPSSCEPLVTACPSDPGTVDWQCADPVADCHGGRDCCALGATLVLGGVVNGIQCANYATSMTATVCVPSGTCPGIMLCTSNGECPPGKTCVPFTKAKNQVGGCI